MFQPRRALQPGRPARLGVTLRATAHLAREAVKLIDHRVDRVLQLQNLPRTSTVILFSIAVARRRS